MWLARQLKLMDWWRVITNHDWVKEDILYAGQDWEGLVALAAVVLYDSGSVWQCVTVYDNVWQCVTVYDNVPRSGWGGLIKHSGRTMPRVSSCHLPPWTEQQSKFCFNQTHYYSVIFCNCLFKHKHCTFFSHTRREIWNLFFFRFYWISIFFVFWTNLITNFSQLPPCPTVIPIIFLQIRLIDTALVSVHTRLASGLDSRQSCCHCQVLSMSTGRANNSDAIWRQKVASFDFRVFC